MTLIARDKNNVSLSADGGKRTEIAVKAPRVAIGEDRYGYIERKVSTRVMEWCIKTNAPIRQQPTFYRVASSRQSRGLAACREQSWAISSFDFPTTVRR